MKIMPSMLTSPSLMKCTLFADRRLGAARRDWALGHERLKKAAVKSACFPANLEFKEKERIVTDGDNKHPASILISMPSLLPEYATHPRGIDWDAAIND